MSIYICGFINTVIYVILCNWFSFILLKTKKAINDIKYSMLVGLWILLEYGAAVVFDNNIILKVMVVILLNIIFLKSLYESRFSKIIGTACLYQAVGILADYAAFIIFKKAGAGIDFESSTQNLTGFLIGLFSQMLMLLLVFWLKSKFYGKEENLREKDWLKLLIVPFFSMISILAILLYFEGSMTLEQENTIVFIVFGLGLMNIFVFYLISDIVKRETDRKQEELAFSHAKRMEKLYMQEKEQFTELQKQRHEYTNQMLAVYSLLENKEYSKASFCLKEYCGANEQLNYYDTNHAVVNTMLNLKYKEALHKEILMVIRFNDLSEIPVSDTDIISLLGNLLDNALEACARCNEKKRWIKVKFVVEKGRMILSAANAWNGEVKREDGEIHTVKADTRLHGYGIKNIQSIVDKYKGTSVIKTEEGEFRFTINIPMN